MDYIKNGIVILSFILSIFAFKKSNDASEKSNKLSEEYNLLVKGQVELQISQAIRESRDKVTHFIWELEKAESKDNQNAIDLLFSLQESNMNAYEDGCSKYFDNKIDRSRFKKTYFEEIKNLVENPHLKKKFLDPTTSRYKCILKIYKEWFDLENS
ncbi:hypothetical protein NRK67_16640 (plasmid) [Fusobacteria bacterium ZRK30]|nr:hypothetical protein NRK67_16640 [Fusobacteria bacterium ZRK30]